MHAKILLLVGETSDAPSTADSDAQISRIIFAVVRIARSHRLQHRVFMQSRGKRRNRVDYVGCHWLCCIGLPRRDTDRRGDAARPSLFAIIGLAAASSGTSLTSRLVAAFALTTHTLLRCFPSPSLICYCIYSFSISPAPLTRCATPSRPAICSALVRGRMPAANVR